MARARSSRSTFASLLFVGIAALMVWAATLSPGGGSSQVEAAEPPFEVWLVDQSNSFGKAYGGAIHVFNGSQVTGKRPYGVQPMVTIDLGAATNDLCQQTSSASPVRPHMLFFNPERTHAILSFVASGHVVIFDTATYEPVGCVRTTAGAGGAIQAHAAVPSPDGTYIMVANQNGKLLQRISTDYDTNTYALDGAATLNLATCTTPNNVACEAPNIRPDNAPICPVIDSSGERGFVTLRGGGLIVVDPAATPMAIIAEYDMATIHGNGCGGQEAGGRMWINSGAGTANNLSEFDVYSFPLSGFSPSNGVNQPAPKLVISDDSPAPNERDGHGMVATKQGRHIWVFDRHRAIAEIFRVGDKNQHIGQVSMELQGIDYTPDLADISPSGNTVFVSLRGPNPLTGDPHNAHGPMPGLGIIKVNGATGRGTLQAVIPITNLDAQNIERADAHGIRVLVK